VLGLQRSWLPRLTYVIHGAACRGLPGDGGASCSLGAGLRCHSLSNTLNPRCPNRGSVDLWSAHNRISKSDRATTCGCHNPMASDRQHLHYLNARFRFSVGETVTLLIGAIWFWAPFGGGRVGIWKCRTAYSCRSDGPIYCTPGSRALDGSINPALPKSFTGRPPVNEPERALGEAPPDVIHG